MSDIRSVLGVEGRICVVTGGGSGIGRATALAFAEGDARVAVLDRNVDGANETLAQVVAAGGAGVAIACDVSDAVNVDAAAGEVRRRVGEVDVLVNNAGAIRTGALETLSLGDWNAILSTNLTGYFLCAQAFGRPMLARGGGAIVHVASVAATQATPNCGSYSVSKAGVTMLSRLLAVEWGPRGVRSNAVHPGLIHTPLSQAAYERPEAVKARELAVASRRIGRPEDVAQAILFLASHRAGYVNGAELTVDGGFSVNYMTQIPRFD
jgi:NAD(P)-dependent dehydrogenase (short-subunit alcohol dehydrogenase family)